MKGRQSWAIHRLQRSSITCLHQSSLQSCVHIGKGLGDRVRRDVWEGIPFLFWVLISECHWTIPTSKALWARAFLTQCLPCECITSEHPKDFPDTGAAGNPGSHFGEFFLLFSCFVNRIIRGGGQQRDWEREPKSIWHWNKSLLHSREHIMGTSLLYSGEVGWVQLWLRTRSQRRGTDQSSGENRGVLKELSTSVLHGKCTTTHQKQLQEQNNAAVKILGLGSCDWALDFTMQYLVPFKLFASMLRAPKDLERYLPVFNFQWW